MTFYNSEGRAVAYTEDNEHIYLFNGIPVGYFWGDLIYSFGGKQLGRFENGWIRDKKGLCVFFTENAQGSGPIRPVKHVRPVKGVKRIKPIKGIRQIASVKAANLMGWSSISGERFFWQ